MSIQVQQLTLVKNNKPLLADVNFATTGGEMIAIVGENGSGKSTLLKCLSGLHETSNSVVINGRALETYSFIEQSLFRAVLPQDNQLAFPFTGEEVVRLGLSLQDRSLEQQSRIIDDCLTQVSAIQYKDRNYIELSGGEKQRVQLARVLAQLSPFELYKNFNTCEKKEGSGLNNDESTELNKQSSGRYLFLDEPTSALDLKHQYQTLKMLKQLCQRNIGVFIVLHDLNLAALYCDKILLMKQGQLIAFEKPENILVEQTIREAFDIDVLIARHPIHNKPYMINPVV